MKKILFIFLLIISMIPTYTFSMNPADFLENIPSNFSSQCYKDYVKISRDHFEKYKTYKLQIDKHVLPKDLVVTQFGFILPTKEFEAEKKYYNYTSSIFPESKQSGSINYFKYVNDDLKETALEVQIEDIESEMIIKLDQVIEKGTFQFDFKYLSRHYLTSFEISNDGEKYSPISIGDINTFSFQYLKILFKTLDTTPLKERIQIYKLSFIKNSSTFLITPYYNDDIEIYHLYNCETSAKYNIVNKEQDFPININTQTLSLQLTPNPKFNVYTSLDFDNDWVDDTSDNCPFRYNPDQFDSNGDGKGDSCSDDDDDGIIGYYDNCPNIKNENQKDVNNNNVGDVCEFDFDEDKIFDSIDNCRNISNPDQEDDDNDGIGNACDNCKYFNPSQIDKDNNGSGDICDQKKKFLEENDTDGDLILNAYDNCKEVPNPDQEDTDKDGIGNTCDNCKNIKNFKQLDLDKNNIGDMCEDSDNDTIIGYLDNCINVANIDQEDDNNNGIGNYCEDLDYDKVIFIKDNCPYDYNPYQQDIDKDLIGDVCDKEDNRYIEHNKDFFTLLIVSLSVIFLLLIFVMIGRLKR